MNGIASRVKIITGIVQKVFSEKASAIARMRQKCVRNASKWVFFYWEKRNVQNASEIRQNCVKNASEMRGTPLGENTFWTIPKIITGSLVTLENLFSQNYRYRYRLEIRMNSFNYHDRYHLGIRSHPFISIDSQLPS